MAVLSINFSSLLMCRWWDIVLIAAFRRDFNMHRIRITNPAGISKALVCTIYNFFDIYIYLTLVSHKLWHYTPMVLACVEDEILFQGISGGFQHASNSNNKSCWDIQGRFYCAPIQYSSLFWYYGAVNNMLTQHHIISSYLYVNNTIFTLFHILRHFFHNRWYF